MEAPRWKIITPSQYEWERRGLDFIRQGLPDHDPYRAWANFEFQTDKGAIYEVDLLVLTKKGFWLVETKAWPGRIWGDSATWYREHERRNSAEDNPVLLANRKAKALSSLLKAQSAIGSKVQLPWLDAVVFLSAEQLQCDLEGPARNRVFVRDRSEAGNKPERKGILAALLNREGPGIDPNQYPLIDAPLARAIDRAMDQAGIRPSQRSRKVGDYLLKELIADGPGYQDWLASHPSFKDIFYRVRQYSVASASSEEERTRLRKAAKVEFQNLRSLEHENILKVTEYKEHENGPSLLFELPSTQTERFDHFLASRGKLLNSTQRLDLLRQVAEAIRHAHGKKIYHRALCPQSILVTDLDSSLPKLRVHNWQVGIREAASSTFQLTNVEDLVETQALVYMSPESLSGAGQISEAADVFSLGAITFHLFANQPPAANLAELSRILRERKGLSISAVQDGVGEKLEVLINWSTNPDAINRVQTVREFLDYLVEVEDELTSPNEKVVNDPMLARKGDKLPNGFVVEKILGKGATAIALGVKKDGKDLVLKVALTEQDNNRLRDEAEVLRQLRNDHIVAIHDELMMGGRKTLVLQKAGDRNLSELLRAEGVPGLDLLARYGDDLLLALNSLEENGFLHRDIKPDNIGILSGTKQRNKLLLFDFSLAKVPLENIRVGTNGYRDPFLPNRKPARWDVAAEIYSAAVTLYEMTLGAGVMPRWGNNVSDPAMTNDPLVIDAEKFDPNVRAGMEAFFRKGLARDPRARFDNADEMRDAWKRIFKAAEQQSVQTSAGEEIDLTISIEKAELTTPVTMLKLSSGSRNVLERSGVTNVREFLNFPLKEIRVMRGVGNKTRIELIECATTLRKRFPELPVQTPKWEKPASEVPSVGPISLEELEQRIIGPRSTKKEAEWNIRATLMGLPPRDHFAVDYWPSQVDVAEQLKITRARISQIQVPDRARWAKDQSISVLRAELLAQILKLGGVVTIEELIEIVILLRPTSSTIEPGRLRRMASIVARAAAEAELASDPPRYVIKRFGKKTLVACSGELATYTQQLGEVADKLARAESLPSTVKIFEELYAVPVPQQPSEAEAFGNERLLRLAAFMSENAAVSARQEIYPRGMSAERALRLGMGALAGLGLAPTTGSEKRDPDPGLTIHSIRERLQSRYPEAEQLPDRPALDAMLNRVGLDLEWNPKRGLYERKNARITTSSGSSILVREPTRQGTPLIEVTAEVAEARQFEERLKHAHGDGGFLVLMVRPNGMRICECELLKKYKLERVSFDQLLIEALRKEAAEMEVDWTYIEEADGFPHSSQDWRDITELTARVMPRVIDDLLSRPNHLLLVHPGFLARYDQMALVERLRDRAGHDAPCPGIWMLVASDEQRDMPVLDHVEIPVITPGQRVRVPEVWLRNKHRTKAKN